MENLIHITAPEKMPFSEFYEKYYNKALSYAQRKTGHLQNAEDLVSETFLYCYIHYDNYNPTRSALSTWLYLILNSRIQNYFRDQKLTKDISELENQLFDESNLLDAEIYLEQLRSRLEKAITTLPERQQKIVTMRYFQELSSETIAHKLGLSTGNVRVLLSRALSKLEKNCRDLLEGFL